MLSSPGFKLGGSECDSKAQLYSFSTGTLHTSLPESWRVPFSKNYHHPTRRSFLAPNTIPGFVRLRDLQGPLEKGKQIKELKGENLTIYPALTVSNESPLISMFRWIFARAGFWFNSDNVCAPITLHPEIVMDRISLPEILLLEYVEPGTLRPLPQTDRAARKRFQIPTPHGFAASLQAHVKRVSGTCPFCDHSEEEDWLGEEESVSG
jgi:hypothetical protein